MFVTSTEGRRPWRAAALQCGFTMVELITVMVLVGVLAVVAMPRMDAAMSLRSAAWRDQVQAGLLQARSLSQGHRRLVCVSVATGEVRISMASINPASSCNTTVSGQDGDARWAVDPHNIAVTVTPSGTLFFQPDGRITSDGAGTSTVSTTIVVTGETGLVLTGETGHVR